MKIKELEINHTYDIFLLLTKKLLKETKTRKHYMQLTLSDGEEEIIANVWDSEAADFNDIEPNTVIKARIEVSDYNQNKSYTIKKTNIRPATDNEPSTDDFIKTAPIKANDMFNYIYDKAKKLHPSCAKLVTYILDINKDALLTSGAAMIAHHNYKSGLLYHTYRMLRLAIFTVKSYESLNKDIVITGVILHDIGKIRELTTNNLGVSEYTDEGILLGHSYLGCETIDQAGAKCGTPKEIIMEIKHIIASHMGEYEFGAIQKPKTKEAVVVHLIDMMDSRITGFEEIEKRINNGQTTPERHKYIGNVNVHKTFILPPLENEEDTNKKSKGKDIPLVVEDDLMALFGGN